MDSTSTDFLAGEDSLFPPMTPRPWSVSTPPSAFVEPDWPVEAWLDWCWLGVAVYLIGTWVVVWSFHVIALVHGKWRLHRKTTVTSTNCEVSLPGVSILKPLCSPSDPNLFQNLETFFTLQYPKYEILFCMQEEDPKIQMYIASLMTKYPKVICQTFYGGENVGVNPKINNIQPGFQASKYELILISDSGIRMKEDTLLDMVSHMSDKVGLVHQMPFACDRTGIPATLEKVYFGTSHARNYLCANLLGINCATGMSSLVRKDLLLRCGGIKTFGQYLAEDYFIAKAVLAEGYKIDICSQPAMQCAGDTSVKNFQSRTSRWVKLRTAMCPHLLLLEPLSECILLGLCASWALFYLVRTPPISFLLIHMLAWFIMDWTLLHVVQNGSLPFNKFEFMVTWIYREITSPYLFFVAQWDPTIVWRAKVFRLKWGGQAEAVNHEEDNAKKIKV